MLAYAIDNPAPSTIILLSGDRDFAYAVSILRLRRYRVVIVSLAGAHTSLKSQASTYLDWTTDIVGAEPLDHCPSPIYACSHHSTKGSLNSRWLYPGKTKLRAQLSTNRMDSEDTETDIMDHFPVNKADRFRRTYSSRTSGDGTPEDSHFGGNDPPSVEDEHSVGTFRPPSRTESAPASCYPGEIASPSKAAVQGKTTSVITSTLRVNQALTPKAKESLIPMAEIREPEQKLSAMSSPSPTISRFGSIPYRFEVDMRPNEYQGQRDIDLVTPGVCLPRQESIPPRETEKFPGFVSMLPTVPMSIVTQVIPPLFIPLVERLEHHRSKGSLRPFRSVIAVELARQYPNVYQQAGVDRFGPYVALAEKAGIIELGGREGLAWIGLRPEWYGVKST